MHEVLHTLSHVIGLCGEAHPKLVDILPYLDIIHQNIKVTDNSLKILVKSLN